MVGWSSKGGPRGRQEEDAVGQVVAFLVAGTIFVGAVGAILLVGQDAAEPTDGQAETASRDLQAGSLLDLLVSSGAIGEPDSLVRLGLAANSTALDTATLDQLRGAGTTADPENGLVDYAEALDSLGMSGLRFHLRMYPVALDDETVDLEDLRVAYIGDWANLPTISVSVSTQAAMLASAQSQLNVSMRTDAQRERAALDALGVDFTNLVHLTAATPRIEVALPLLPDPPLLNYLGLSLVAGDVYPDNKAYLTAVLPSRLDEYDVIIVGSGVDHEAMSPNAVKTPLADWVVDGGTLVVLGTNERHAEWLNPLFHAAVRNVNGGPFAPDVAHPLLLEPNDLDWESYDNEGRVWDLKESGSGAQYEDFTHVIVIGDEDILAVSNQGTFGDGRVFITTYQPGDIVASQGSQEAQDFFENMLTYSENEHLYLEYGPLIPSDAEVVTAVRSSSLWDPAIGHVPVRIELHLWQDPSDV